MRKQARAADAKESASDTIRVPHLLADRPVCVACTVCGGKCPPGDFGLCVACRGLAATFARAIPLEARP